MIQMFFFTLLFTQNVYPLLVILISLPLTALFFSYFKGMHIILYLKNEDSSSR